MLRLVPPQQARAAGDDRSVFRTLAQAYGQRAVCVILSGSDSDGVIGLKHIRAQGGLTIVQDPNEAQFDSMPATAISTGMVDWVLPVADMTPKLLEFVRNEHGMRLPPEIPESKHIRDARRRITIAQDPNEAEHDSMPLTAISTRHDRLGAAGRADAGEAARVRPQRARDAIAVGDSGADGRTSRYRTRPVARRFRRKRARRRTKRRWWTCWRICGRRRVTIFSITSAPPCCAASRVGCR